MANLIHGTKQRYKVTMIIETDYHPRKWVAETINESLDFSEKLIDFECEIIEEDEVPVQQSVVSSNIN